MSDKNTKTAKKTTNTTKATKTTSAKIPSKTSTKTTKKEPIITPVGAVSKPGIIVEVIFVIIQLSILIANIVIDVKDISGTPFSDFIREYGAYIVMMIGIFVATNTSAYKKKLEKKK